MIVRDESPADLDAVREVVTRAFEQPDEAVLVEALRSAGKATISLGHAYVVVLGSPVYYGRFGFVPADRFGLGCVYDVPPGVFQVLEIAPGALAGRRGLVRYADEFAAV